VKLTAVPNAGYAFSNWGGDASGSTNPVSITMTGNKSVTANLREITSTLISPANTVNSWDKSFHWTGVTGATRYYLEFQKADGTLVLRKWYYTNTSCTGLDCAVTATELAGIANGDYKWHILDYGVYGYGSWAPYKNFTLP